MFNPYDTPACPDAILRFPYHSSDIQSLAFHPENENILLSTDAAGYVCTSSLASRRCISHNTPYKDVVDDSNVICAQFDRKNSDYVWTQERHGQLCRGLFNGSFDSHISTCPYSFCKFELLGNSSIATHHSESQLAIWDTNITKSPSLLIDYPVATFGQCLVISSHLNCPNLIVVGYESGNTVFYDLRRIDNPFVHTLPHAIMALSIFQSETDIYTTSATAEGTIQLLKGSLTQLNQFSPHGNRNIHSLLGPTEKIGINSISFRSDGKVFATGNWNGSVTLFARKGHGNRHLLHFPQVHNNGVTALKYHPITKTLVSGGKDGSIALWDTL